MPNDSPTSAVKSTSMTLAYGAHIAASQSTAIPFDRAAHETKLKGGVSRFREYDNSIEMLQMHARGAHGKGFGTAAFREMLTKYFAKNMHGGIELSSAIAYGSTPHVFYLYMGMVPSIETHVTYLKHFCSYQGWEAEQALQNLQQYPDLDSWQKNLTSKDLRSISNMLHKLSSLKVLPADIQKHEIFNTPPEKITVEQLFESKDFLLNFVGKEINYYKDIFIPAVLSDLRRGLFVANNKFPETTKLGPIEMHMSTEGFARWKDAINNNTEFEPFKELQQLETHLSSEDKQELAYLAKAYQEQKVNGHAHFDNISEEDVKQLSSERYHPGKYSTPKESGMSPG